MSTPHIAAERGEIAERVLLRGDPLRAKHIAETFLTDARCYSNIRNVLGYTGLYKGKRISVQSTGMAFRLSPSTRKSSSRNTAPRHSFASAMS